MENKGTTTQRTILKRERKEQSYSKTVGNWQRKNKHVIQWNRIKSPEMGQ